MNAIDIEWSKRPIPNKKAKTPVNIGFRDHAYGPSVTSSRGGLKGTGVPLALKNQTIHQIQNTNPNKRRITPQIVTIGPESISENPSALSVCRLPKTTSKSNPQNTMSPTGVRINRRRLEPVATLYNNSIGLIFLFI